MDTTSHYLAACTHGLISYATGDCPHKSNHDFRCVCGNAWPCPIIKLNERLIVLTDIVGYSSPIRNHVDRTRMRNQLDLVMRTLFGSDHDSWYEGRGDGMLVVLPETITQMEGISLAFQSTGKQLLERYNNRAAVSARMSLRVALDRGEVDTDLMGFNGNCMIRAGRLIDSKLFKRAMAASRATIGLITPTELTRRFNLGGFSNVRTQVKGMPINASMRFM